MKLDKAKALKIIKAALKEDIGTGDVTTRSTIPRRKSVKASIISNDDCVLSGVNIAEWIINTVDRSVRFKPLFKDGERVSKGKEIIFLEGRGRSILTAERTMLNFLCFLSGVSTRVSRFVEKTKNYGVKIYDTRKTLPLLRCLEKYAVSVGGGYNHRLGLWDGVLIKENHIRLAAAAGMENLIKEARKKTGRGMRVEIESQSLDEFERLLKEKPDIIMLDNMGASDVAKAVNLRERKGAKKVLLEASGGINLENVVEYAKTGVDIISIGSLTDSVESIDMSLDIHV